MQPIGPYNRWPPQVVPTTSLTITIANEVDYVDNVSDPNTFATNPNAVTIKPPPPDNFVLVTIIGDIVAVNGEAVRGTYVGRTASIRAQPAAIATTPPGWAIADISRAALRESVFEILKADGTTQIGTIMTMGLSRRDFSARCSLGAPNQPALGAGGEFRDCRWNWSVSRGARSGRRIWWRRAHGLHDGRSKEPHHKHRPRQHIFFAHNSNGDSRNCPGVFRGWDCPRTASEAWREGDASRNWTWPSESERRSRPAVSSQRACQFTDNGYSKRQSM